MNSTTSSSPTATGFSGRSSTAKTGCLIGCHSCMVRNLTDYPAPYGYRLAFRTAFRAILSRENFKGITYLRTFSPAHFDGGGWNGGGNCMRTRPFESNEAILEGVYLDMYNAQIEEFRVAEKKGRERGLKFRVIDVTHAMLLRPDGHPSRYGHWSNATKPNDCVHWCMPGPIDTWNDFLLNMMKME
ncbi:hypothetical protein Nepgr_029018 [Nepenthes gracilis]|uniref:Trichome birefringence-like C-terminal domain-containing protein n=1 Tax=Nepenthes gracilis TaxID=150966 RepID=A0AAD3TCT5_NEPGR|nr:hypothetical protein Nepgr_029018 [Nepenthes gracilis]